MVKRKSISSKTFYGKANKYAKVGAAGYKLGKAVYNKYKQGQKVVQTARRVYRKFTRRSRANHYTGPIGSHNDWVSLKRINIYVNKNKPMKTYGNFDFIHAKDYIVENQYVGTQRVFNGQSLCTRNQLAGTTLASDITEFSAQFLTSPFELNPYSTAPNNSIYTQTPAAVIAADKIYLKSIQSTLKFVSMSPIAQKVQVFFYLCKKDHGDDPVNAWNDILTTTKYLQTLTGVGPSTYASTAVISTGQLLQDFPGSQPPSRMAQRWKSLHHDQFMLQPGDNLSLTRNFIINRMFNKDFLSEHTVNFMRNVTICTMVIVEGAIVGMGDTNTVPATNVDKVTNGRTKVGYVHTDHYKFAALPVNRFDITRAEIGFVQNNTSNVTSIIDADDSIIDGATMT